MLDNVFTYVFLNTLSENLATALILASEFLKMDNQTVTQSTTLACEL